MLLPFEVDARFKKDDTFVLLGVHLHQRLHKVLRNNEQDEDQCQQVSECRKVKESAPPPGSRPAYLNLIPCLIVCVQRAKVVLYRDDSAVTGYKLFIF